MAWEKDALTGKRWIPVSFIGCASHRFNLAVKSIYGDDEDNELDDGTSISGLIGRVHEIMKKVRSLKLRSQLHEKTELTKQNTLVVHSKHEFLIFEACRIKSYSLSRLALNVAQMHYLQELADVFKDLEKATLHLQTNDF